MYNLRTHLAAAILFPQIYVISWPAFTDVAPGKANLKQVHWRKKKDPCKQKAYLQSLRIQYLGYPAPWPGIWKKGSGQANGPVSRYSGQ